MTNELCPTCGMTRELGKLLCACGHRYPENPAPAEGKYIITASSPRQQTSGMGAPHSLPEAAIDVNQRSNALIVATWVCFAVFVLAISVFPLSAGAWIGSMVTAILLIRTRNNTNRINGWATLGLNSIGCIGILVVAITMFNFMNDLTRQMVPAMERMNYQIQEGPQPSSRSKSKSVGDKAKPKTVR